MRRLIIAAMLLAAASAASAQPAEPVNLVPNGDFSVVAAGKPDRWEVSANPKDVDVVLRAGKDEEGRPCAVLVCTRCERNTGWSHAMLAQIGGATLAKDRVYELTLRMRAENLRGRTVGVALQETKGWLPGGLSEQVSVGAKWKACKFTFMAPRDIGPTGRLQIWFSEPGTLYVADVRIVEQAPGEVAFTDVILDVGSRNLLFNGSFEVGPARWSSLGQGAGWGDLDHLHGTIEATGGPARQSLGDGGTHGKSFLRIPLGGERTPVLYFDYYEPTVRRELRPLAASLGWIKVEKGAAYTVSCDLRASADGVRATLGARSRDPGSWYRDYKQVLQLTTSWKRYSFTFKPTHRYAFVFVGPDLAEEARVHVDVDAVQLEKGDRATGFVPRAAVEYALEPSSPGGIFVYGEPASLIVRGANYSTTPVQVPVKFTATDFNDAPATLGGLSLDLPANSGAQKEVKLPADWKGFYRVRATFGPDDLPPAGDLRVAVLPRRTADDSVCGINHAFTSDRLIRLASKFGVTWYRDWTLKWQHIEPAKGEFHWEVGDAQIDRVLKEGVHVLPLLPPFPSADWSSEAPASLPATGYPGVRLRQAWAPKDPADMAGFIEKAAARYKDRIHVYEFLNEPVYTSYALPADRENAYGGKKYTPADYVALLEVAARAMRKGDPACRVMGGIAGGPALFTREVIEAGCLKHVDIFNLHAYPGRRAPEAFVGEMDELLALMDRHGGRKPVWFTEFSYYATDDLPRKPFFPLPNAWSEARLVQSERQCAQFTVRFFAIMLSHGVEKVFVHSGASGRANDPQYECAFFEYGGAPRKLACAMAVLTELLGAKPVSAGYARLGDSGHAAAFETPKQSVLILWEEEDGPNAALSGLPATNARWFDLMGREMSARAVKLSPSPVYLVGPAGKAREFLNALRILPGILPKGA